MNALSDILVVVVGLDGLGWRQMIVMDVLVCSYAADRTNRWVDVDVS